MQTVVRSVQWMLAAMTLAAAFLFWPQSLGGKVAYVKVDGQSMEPTFHFGDLAIVSRQSSYQVGNAVAYRIPKGEFGAGALVIHRLVGGDGTHGWATKGDNRTIKDPWHPRNGDILGRVRYDVPGAGTTVADLTRPVYVGALIASLTVIVMLIPSRADRRRRRQPRGRHAATAPIEVVI